MIRRILPSFFKRYIGLFISMVFVSMLSVALLCTFVSSITNLKSIYASYLDKYGNVDEQVSISLVEKSDLTPLNDIAEIETYDARLTLDSFLKKDDGRTIVTRVFSYDEKNDGVFKRYILESKEPDKNIPNLSICRKFAKNNGFKLGDTIQLGYFGIFADFHISEIVETAEGIYPRANDYIWSDNQDFGYMYINNTELTKALLSLAEVVKERIASDSEFAEEYERIVSITGITFPDLRTIDAHFVDDFANQIIVRNVEGTGSNDVLKKIEKVVKDIGSEVKTATIGENLPYRVYMSNAIRQLTIASVFLPVFFYSVAMIVIGLFMNQIIKSMTSQIGVLMSIGVGYGDIISVFLAFAALMGLTSGVLGVPIGYGINVLLVNVMIQTYSIPILTASLSIPICALAIGALVLFALLATFLSCLTIFKISPKDAVISNESKRRKMPKAIEKVIDKGPLNIKLGVNSIVQNPRRFFVSAFSIAASIILILLSSFFYVSKNEMISQSVNRRLNYDCQIYFTEKEEQSSIDDFRSQSFIKEDEDGDKLFEDCYYTYVQATHGGDPIYLECLAFDPSSQADLISIPGSNGSGEINIQETGVILPKTDAQRLGVKKGETITINEKAVVVTDISFQYFHPITYLSKTQMKDISDQYVSSFILDVQDEEAFLTYLSENKNQCLTVFTRSLAKDLYAIFNSIDVFIYIMIGFSLGMSFVILTIMSQNALLEQQRQISVMRAIGFRVLDISNLWTLQSIGQIILSAIVAIPAGVGVSLILFKMCSSAAQIYPFIFSWPVVLMALGFVLVVIASAHGISMFTIRRWNLADNTRSRE